jgi:glycosyltransferase involved in cell wall biosynthesis/predicted protein tyrosine phosphatase
MKIAFVYGTMCLGGRPYNFHDLYGDPRGMTGSEVGVIVFASEMARRGHDVRFYVDNPNADSYEGVRVRPLPFLEKEMGDLDVLYSWSMPDYLRMAPPGVLRMNNQQLNDFTYCAWDYDKFVDVYTSPSQAHLEQMSRLTGSREKWVVLHNGVFPDDYRFDRKVPGRVIYASSPDRGLHWVLQEWPKIRRAVPHAHLRVFYFSLKRWAGHFHNEENNKNRHIREHARRGAYVLRALDQLKPAGVEMIGGVSRRGIAQEYSEAQVLAYPTDTTSWTEGFSVATLEGCASQALPVICTVDALEQIYGRVLPHVKPPMREHASQWSDMVIRALTDEPWRKQQAEKASAFAQDFAWPALAEQLEQIILQRRPDLAPGRRDAVPAQRPLPAVREATPAAAPKRKEETTMDRKGTLIERGANKCADIPDGWQRWWLDDRIMVGGSIDGMDDGTRLQAEYGIGRVISVESERSDDGDGFFEEDGDLLYRPFPDWGEAIVGPIIHDVLDFAQKALDDGKSIYVHCQQGGSRSPAMGYAICRGVLKMSPEQVLERIRRVLPRFGESVTHQMYMNSIESAMTWWRKPLSEDRYGLVQKYQDNNNNTAWRYWLSNRLFVGGSFTSRQDYEAVCHEHGVTAVINVSSDVPPNQGHGIERLLHRPFADDGQAIDESVVHDALDFAAAELAKPASVVHVQCSLGHSRSPTIAYAIARAVLNMSAEEFMRRIHMLLPGFPAHPTFIRSAEAAVQSWIRKTGAGAPEPEPARHSAIVHRSSRPVSVHLALTRDAASYQTIDIDRLDDDQYGGGSRAGFLGLSRALARRGYEVKAFSSFARNAHRDGVDYLTIDQIRAHGEPDVLFAYFDMSILQNRSGMLRIGSHHSFRPFPDYNTDWIDVHTMPSRYAVEYAEKWIDPWRPWYELPNAVEIEGDWTPIYGRVVHHASPSRGLHLLLEMWPAIRQRVPDATLHLMGTFEQFMNSVKNGEQGRRAEAIRHGLRTAGAAGGVVPLGALPRSTLVRELAHASCFAFPASAPYPTETFSNSVLECCTLGVPVVMTPIDAMRPIYEGSVLMTPNIDLDPTTGLILDASERARRKEQFVTVVTQVLTDPSTARQWSSRQKVLAAKYSFDRTAAALSDIIERHLPRRQEGGRAAAE